MPTVRVNGVDLHYVLHGTGAETVVFTHSYLADLRQFQAQIQALEPRFRVLAFDFRDHGSSGRSGSGYELSTLVDDTEALLEELDLWPCHFVGHSTGGFVGLRLATRRPGDLKSLIVMDSSAESESWWARCKYGAMLAIARGWGIRPLVPTVMRLMFSAGFLRDPERQAEVSRWREIFLSADPLALTRFGKAIFSRRSFVDETIADRGTVSGPGRREGPSNSGWPGSNDGPWDSERPIVGCSWCRAPVDGR